jgi:pyrroline-5-carboxylate reductase
MKLTIGIIGVGKLGKCLVEGIKNQGQFQVIGSTGTESEATEVRTQLEIECFTDNDELVGAAQILLLCVKPYLAKKVLQSLSPHLRKEQVLISVCAGLSLKQLTGWVSNKIPVIRAMPSTLSAVGESLTVLSAGPLVPKQHSRAATELFSSLGEAVWIEEDLMHAATGLGGCGPAYAYLFLEGLTEAGINAGLSYSIALKMAAQTFLGASKMVLEKKIHPAALKSEVTTPNGCTIAGVFELEKGNTRATLMKAVAAATRRSRELLADSLD